MSEKEEELERRTVYLTLSVPVTLTTDKDKKIPTQEVLETLIDRIDEAVNGWEPSDNDAGVAADVGEITHKINKR
jgi:hypothetical protein